MVEKGSEVGAHILSGAVIDPVGLDRLLPDWRSEDTPIKTAVDATTASIVLGAVGRAAAAEFPDAAADEQSRQLHRLARQRLPLARDQGGSARASKSIRALPRPKFSSTANGAVAGVATGDMGIGKDGEPKDSFTRGMELRAKYTLFAEGARGNLGKQLIARFGLGDGPRAAEIRHRAEGAVAGRAGEAPQRAGAAFVRLAARQLRPAAARSSITSTTIWCRSASSFISTTTNPYLSPFEEFQRFKTHPLVRDTFDGGKRLAYGARAITEGGYQSVPKLAFPGGALIGCAAGFMNVPRIKGSHNAMLSGMLAAEHVAAALAAGRAHDELSDYEAAWRDSRDRPRSLEGAQRQAAVVEVRHASSASRSAASTCGPTRSASRCSARSATASRIMPR